MSDAKMKVLDLFSGIGGFSLGLERAGMETVAFCEIEKFPQDVLKKHWPEVPLFPDVKLLNAKMLPEVDLICGGFPCQDISVAGKKKGLIDEAGNTTRSGLWFEFKRLIKEIEPKYVIIENVANLRNNGLATVIKDLWEIGYVGEWHIISARSVGACHLRERVWIVAYPRCRLGWSGDKGNSEEFRGGETINSEIGTQDALEIKRSSNGRQANSGELDSIESANSTSERCEASVFFTKGNRGSPGEGPKGGVGFNSPMCQKSPQGISPNSNHLRLWKPFATEEAKQQWWAETTIGFSDWWEVESSICRVDDGLPRGLDKDRSRRIKALGNTIVPQIAELIGRSIINHENGGANELN